jgi:hypothetical protein
MKTDLNQIRGAAAVKDFINFPLFRVCGISQVQKVHPEEEAAVGTESNSGDRRLWLRRQSKGQKQRKHEKFVLVTIR